MYTMPMRGEQIVRITADQATNFDIAPWVNAGQALLTVVVDSGVTVNSTNASLGAIYSSETIIAARSKVTVRNSGTILGCNGAGGAGNGNSGSKGCDGINLNCAIILHNLSGQITSGGGGGGGGAFGFDVELNSYGGGGGAGYPGGAGGSGTIPQLDGFPGATVQYGTGTGGASSGGGKGGDCNGAAQAGGTGGTSDGFPGAGGAAGIGVNSNGNGVTIVSGAANIIGGTA